MNTKQMLEFLDCLERSRAWAFTFNDARAWFREKPATLKSSLARHVGNTLIVHVSRGLYANARSRLIRPGMNSGELAKLLRLGKFSYLSLESALSECGAISQVCTIHTFVSEGREGLHRTPFGTLEFCHGRMPPLDQMAFHAEQKIWRASPMLAYQDLARIRPQIASDLVDMEALAEAEADYQEWRKGIVTV